jgi:hypothetical protein
MKNGSKSNQKQAGSQGGMLGKRDAPEGKNAAKTAADSGTAAASTSKEMEAELLRLMRENDKLKNQLSDSQGEVNLNGHNIAFFNYGLLYQSLVSPPGQASQRSY